MLKNGFFAFFIILLLIIIYFLTWPVPIEPVAWKAPPNQGYSGPFTRNELLKATEFLKIGNYHGPEDVAVDDQGRIYLATHEGAIVRLQPDGDAPEKWVETKGRPLGLDFDKAGNLIVADAFRGLLSVSQEGKITELATSADGIPIRYADDVDCAADGKIYFSDASTKFGARDAYGHIIAIDGDGKVLKDLQDSKTGYPQNTSVTETEEFLYIGSLISPVVARLDKSKVGL